MNIVLDSFLGRNLSVRVASIASNQGIIFFMSAEDTTIIGTQEETQLHILPSSLSWAAMLSLSEKVLLSQTVFIFQTVCVLMYVVMK